MTTQPMGESGRLQLVLAICADLLEYDEVQPTDNFVDLGGDSLKAMRLVADARKHGLQISLRMVFHCNTLADLARAATTLA
jgi:aryl carrier-like protein